MLRFVIRRLLWTIPVVLVCVTILFALMRVGGGNFLRHPPPAGLSNIGWVKYGDPKPESITRNIERRLGLDLPWYEQYAHYLGSVARLDFDLPSWSDVRPGAGAWGGIVAPSSLS